MERAILAGGCFWGMEDLFRHLPGVVSTCVGYCGGDFLNPTYNDVKTGKTGHAEAIEIVFDPAETDFKTVLALFFRIHDPTTLNRQGNDIGSQYRSAIFYLNEGQKKIAEDYINAINASGKWPGRVVTELKSAGKFYQAEEYHQNYLQRYPEGYTCHWARPDWKL